jgi:hypothetical protein
LTKPLSRLQIWGGLIKNLVQHEIGSFGEGIVLTYLLLTYLEPSKPLGQVLGGLRMQSFCFQQDLASAALRKFRDRLRSLS